MRFRRRAAGIAGAGLLPLSHALSHAGRVAWAADTAPLQGLLATVAATAEALPSAADAAPAGLVLEVTLHNATSEELGGLELLLPLPAQSQVADSWQGRREQHRGTLDGQRIRWSGLSIKAGERLPPFALRLAPAPGADGATVFRQATVQPELRWARPRQGQATPPALRLNGLWGETGLRRTVLPNGLTLFTRERQDSATVAIRLAVRAGSRDEDDRTSGGSHWLEHAYFLGTRSRPNAQDIDSVISGVGGQSNAATSSEFTDYWKLVPAEHFDTALEVLADQMLNSTFLPEAFERERQVVFEELKQRNDAPGTRAFDEFLRLVFQVSPLRRDPGGTIESVQSIPIATILSHKDRHYVSGNVAIAASGNLRHVETVDKIAQAFSTFPRGPQHPRPPTPEPAQQSPRRLELGDGTQVAEIRLGWPLPGDDHPAAPACYVLVDVLGPTGRRLTEELRDRRALVTSVTPSYLSFSDAGALMIAAATQPAREQEVIQLLLAEIERLRRGEVSEADIATSLRAIAGRRALYDELNLQQTERADTEVSGTLDSYAEYLARLRTVTAADVQRVAQQYLHPTNYTLVVVRR
jgi:predicted Zn-dependent peptidase